jgi:preprotein translocase subunit SecG
MQVYLHVAQIVLAVTLVLVILLQVKGGGLGGVFGQPDTVYRTKRGVVFVIISLVALKMV